MVVIGGGLVGLTTALELCRHGVDVLLVEKHAVTSPQPKARRFGFRSMEVFRSLGLAGTVRDAARDLAGHDRFAAGETLATSELQPMWGGAPIEPSPELVGPEPPSLVAQDVLEPVLAAAAADAGAEVHFGFAVTGVAPDAHGVTVETAEGPVRARYVVAADGARSPVREALGVTRSGPGAVGAPAVNVYFRADLAPLVADRPFNLCTVAGGAFASVDGRHRWVFMTSAGRQDWPAVLRSAIGAPVPDLEVLSVLDWCPEVRVADRFRVGRVLLAGDAAHVMPPWAAAGANTGIADAHNLGWKLAAVLRGEASDALLDSYDAERRPTAAFVADQSVRRSSARGVPDQEMAHPFVLSAESIAYPEGAFVRDDDREEPVTAFAPTGRAGVRVPHRWLDDARTTSTLDLAGPGWATDVDGGERVLLRPDGVVAWRGADPDGPERHRRELLAARALPGGSRDRRGCRDGDP
ncbi:2-polyprenyl-6-methoxyphenol hydroxylase-like FAD-dependent oxidoreductase [Pseudonocardia endophytica]|uniref:2-polyprenyl-6-methoxyphenol hydroxylase-like FAD-dependent oxidoreductase n=1 Tax=Pseudonocardia endophytica TaxID=401976 RepID=A0A4R1HTI3_PSEEN|nr:2-polyprenyl-6-methoxyphenol hydroxylase-like FAD-dependent oxidoreductase [Pseudonocardia endophytica]